jgi:hypothetical protein
VDKTDGLAVNNESDMRKLGWILSLVLGAALAGCGNNMTSPTQTSCRTFATSGSGQDGSFTLVAAQFSCSFSSASVSLSCLISYTDTPDDLKGDVTVVTTWNSIADLVDETAVVGRTFFQRIRHDEVDTTLSTGHRLVFGSTRTATYDGQRRLARSVLLEDDGSGFTDTATTWDASGRPTAGIECEGMSPCSNLVLAYDDSGRTITGRQDNSVYTPVVLDSNGIPIRGLKGASNGSLTVPTRFGALPEGFGGNLTVSSTAQVCK